MVLLFPESPPRFAQDGIVDYIARYDILHGANLSQSRPGVNSFAAMPSMHIAWMTWSAYAAWSAIREHHPRVAWLTWLLPGCTAFVVLATGHHYLLDIVSAWALVALAIQLTRRVSRGRTRCPRDRAS